MISMGNLLTGVIILNGTAAGSWKRAITKLNVEVKLSPFRTLNADEKKTLGKEVARYTKFLGIPTKTS